MLRHKSGSKAARSRLNFETDTEILVTTGAVVIALDPLKGRSIFAPTGNTTGITLAAPTKDGQRKLMSNTKAFSVTVTVTGMAVATQNVFVFSATVDTAVGPSVELEAINTGTLAVPVLQWIPVSSAGFIVGAGQTSNVA